MLNTAPIGVSIYSRISHLQKTISALKNNELSRQSELYIFSDAPKPADFKKVLEIRKYVRTINGFKKVTIIERKTNNYIFNGINGIEHLVNKYGKMIFLEEDIITAPGFLRFMNMALQFYENNPKVFSISGYSPEMNVYTNCKEDYFVLPRFNAWGFGIWKDRYDTITSIPSEELKTILSNQSKRKIISRTMGEDVLLMLQYEAENILDAWDIKAMFQQIISNKYTIYPKRSLVQNIGHDGTGIHCSPTDKYRTVLWQKTNFNFGHSLSMNKKILESHYEFRKINPKDKLLLYLREYKLYSFLKKCKALVLKIFNN